MRESCSCGAAIHTLLYRRALTWRYTHQHNPAEMNEITSDLSFPTGFQPEPDEEPE